MIDRKCTCGRLEYDFAHDTESPEFDHRFRGVVLPGVSSKTQEKPSIYVIGSLKNERIPLVANMLRAVGWDVFDDWYGAGSDADDHWQAYEKTRGRNFKEALAGRAAQHIFQLDEQNIDRCGAGLLVMPAGKSGHIELGVFVGQKKPRYILLDGEPERYDLMYNYATQVFLSVDEMLAALKR